MTYTVSLLFYGNKLAVTATEPSNVGNSNEPGFEMKIVNASAIGSDSDLFRLVWTGNKNATDTEFKNGQFWSIQRYDPAADNDGDPANGDNGWSTVYSDLIPKPDLVQQMGAGSDYIVMSKGGVHVIFDINANFSTTPTTLHYPGSMTNGSLTFAEATEAFAFRADPGAGEVPCFVLGTMIETPTGPRAIETLGVGDLVLTRDRGPRAIRWIGRRHFAAAELQAAPHLRPIRIRAGALGDGLPGADLLVSPQHRVLLRSKIALRMFDAPEILVAAKQLLQIEGIDYAEEAAGVTYLHMLFDRHEVVISNGAETESLYPGPNALKAVGRAARDEIFAIFPELARPEAAPSPARQIVPGRQARRLVSRHIQHRRALVGRA